MKKILILIWSVTAFVLLSVGIGSTSDLPNCPKYGTKHNCQGTYTGADGGKYVGEYKDGERNGQGTQTWGPNSKWAGDKYVGEFKDALRNGQGTYTFENGSVKEGIWRKGVFQYSKKSSPKSKGVVVSLVGQEFKKLSIRNRKTIQTVLKKAGYYKSSIDGLWGKGTYSAIKKYASATLRSDWLYTSSKSANLLSEIQKISNTTKVVEKSCQNNMYSCSNIELCKLSTFTSGGKKKWYNNSYKYVMEAKSRGLNCGGAINSVNANTCQIKTQSCSNAEVCRRATFTSSGKTKWFKYYSNNYVVEAKGRMLSCGVSTTTAKISPKAKTCSDDPSLCTTAKLCSIATTVRGSSTIWDTRSAYSKYVAHAQSKGLPCGVSAYIAKAEPQAKTCKDNPSLCTVVQLCKAATNLTNGQRAWSTTYKSSGYVKEAKKNGVTCGVKIKVAKQPKKEELIPAASGSGFYVSKVGHIITNNHVIKGCESVKVHLQGEVLNAKILSKDVVNDLALVKTNNTPETIFSLSSESPYLTQDVTAAGYPLVSTLGLTIKVTKGIVSALSAPGNFSNIQIDAAVQPGNSGGPIFDEEGNVMGVVVAKLDDDKAQNVNFGIKASVVRNLLDANSVATLPPRKEISNKRAFSDEMRKGTVLLSCWMTMAQIEQLKTKKVLFKEFE